ncbi:hypothetical protein ACS5PN_12035 [Roseateles sp. NT4]|uniref:hypothetical protein n=1 Tax=Roseateles sp. NT4 TaxID=3453715 RepID=UPI003EE98832
MRSVSRWLIWPATQRAIAAPLLLVALGLGLLCAVASDDAIMTLTIWAATLAGAGLCVLAFGLRLPAPANRNSGITYAAVVTATLLSLGLAIHVLGMRQFGGYDMSLVVDFGWRQLQGQRFPADFPNTTPPSFLLGTLWAFQLGGVSWQSLVDVFALFSLASMVWVLWLWRALLGRPWMAALLATSLIAMAMLPLSSWWYNPITSAAGVIFALSSALTWLRPGQRRAWVSWAGSVALLASAKPNVAGVMLLPVALLFLISRAHRGPAVLAGLIALAGLEGLLRAYGMSLADFVAGYRGVAERGVVIGAGFVNASALVVVTALAGLALALLPLGVLVPRTLRPGSDPRLAFIGAVTIATGALAFVTSGEVKLVDMVIIHAGLMIWALAVGVAPSLDAQAPVDGPGLAGRYLVATAVLGIFMGAGVALSRQRVSSIGPRTFFEHSTRPEPFADGFFKGLTAGPRLHGTYADVARLLEGQPRRAIFFGPRMQWAYAAFRQGSPVGEPVWFQPGFSFAVSRQDGYFAEASNGRFELMVFLKGDYTFFPPAFMARLDRRYERVPGFEFIEVYRRRPG